MGEPGMIPLRARSIQFNDAAIAAGAKILRLSGNAERPRALRRSEAFVISDGQTIAPDFAWYISCGADVPEELRSNSPVVELPADFGYLGDGDVISLEPTSGIARVLFRKASSYNHFLLT